MEMHSLAVLTIAAAGLITCLSLSVGAGESALATNLESGRPQTVVAYGTSLTHEGAWPAQLQEALDRKYAGLAKVINSAQGAMWSKWGVENLDERVISKAPDTVLIEFAINDAYLPYQTSTAECRANLETIIDRILDANPNCEIVLMTMNPPTGIHLEQRPEIEAYYEVYRQVAKERGLRLVDHYPSWLRILKEDEATFFEYVPDGLHPEALGCQKVITPYLLERLGVRGLSAD